MLLKKNLRAIVALDFMLVCCVCFVSSDACAVEIVKTPTLQEPDGWATDTVSPGLVHLTFSGLDPVSGSPQIVNVLEVDLTGNRYGINLFYSDEAVTCSEAARRDSAVGGINAGYEVEAIYIRKDGTTISEVTLPDGHQRFWKHEGAVCWSSPSDMELVFAGKDGADAMEFYRNCSAKNIIASAPMLVDGFEPVGTKFVDAGLTMEQLQSIDYEDPRRHQGVRHPRTAVALTADRDLLLITVDGRRGGVSEGMNARELTGFIVKYFNPSYALNLDGGGSTTMVVRKGCDDGAQVVNYPTDNGVFDHDGERRVCTHLLITDSERE